MLDELEAAIVDGISAIVKDVCELPGDNDINADDTLVLSVDELYIILGRYLPALIAAARERDAMREALKAIEDAPAQPDARTVERARAICAEVEGENKGYQYTDGSRDDYPMMRAVLAALRPAQDDAVRLLRKARRGIAFQPHPITADGAADKAHLLSEIDAYLAKLGEPQ